jgi:hypothetical protein
MLRNRANIDGKVKRKGYVSNETTGSKANGETEGIKGRENEKM